MKQLIFMIGLPRSGKSTYAKELAKEMNATIVCPDDIRLALHGQRFYRDAEDFVWANCKLMIRSLFLSENQNIILDATNLSASNRNRFKNLGEDKRLAKIIDTDLETCIQRAKDTNQDDLIPIIKNMHVKSFVSQNIIIHDDEEIEII